MVQFLGLNVSLDMFSGYGGEVTISRPDLIQVSFGPDYVGNYWGSFQYNGPTLVGGSVTSYGEVLAGQSILNVTGLNVPAVTAATLIAKDDTLGLLNLVFGGDDSLGGSTGGDTLVGLNGNDSVNGYEGDDDLNGNQGADMVFGALGADTVRGGQGADTVSGGPGNDPHVNGNIGNDYVQGGEGADTVFGGQGDDYLWGENGDDRLSGDLGNDGLTGGAGADIFWLHAGTQLDLVIDFNAAEGDRVGIPKGHTYTLTTIGGDVAVVLDRPFPSSLDVMVLHSFTQAQFQDSWVVFV